MQQNVRLLQGKFQKNFINLSVKKSSSSNHYEDLKNKIYKHNIKTVTMGFPDLYGRFMGKKFDSEYFLTVFYVFI